MAGTSSVAQGKNLTLDLGAARSQARRLAALAPIAPGSADRDAADRLRLAERDLVAPDGIPDRPWFRHLVYAPPIAWGPSRHDSAAPRHTGPCLTRPRP